MALSLGLSAGVAGAAAISFESVSGSWTDASTVPTLQGLGTDSIRWGRPASGLGQSGYDFDGAAPFSAETGSSFSLGRFVHLNRPIYGPSISTAQLSINYSFRFDANPARLFQRAFQIDLTHLETLNRAPICADGGATGVGVNVAGCADRVTLGLFGAIVDTFTVGNRIFTFTLGGFDPGGTFWTEEGRDNVSNLMGRVDVEVSETNGDGDNGNTPPVPLPAAGWLFAAALMGLGLFRRRA